MSWRTVVYLEVRCDRCGELAPDPDEPCLFLSLEQARALLASDGWAVLGDAMTCPTCVDRVGCALLGHCWEPWQDRAWHDRVGRTRTCPACRSIEYDPALITVDADRRADP
ncbi:hypothetical protein [Frankia sp. Cas3]|uniref:hypothetical protein n=1 Tax=Frankia sp. Cas3 TaxID=3073926 RepID=UPI002AD28FA8|nr:hypothetical protein [Frankia sp. Cas3]